MATVPKIRFFTRRVWWIKAPPSSFLAQNYICRKPVPVKSDIPLQGQSLTVENLV